MTYQNGINNNIQVLAEHYDFSSYVTPQRWMSYYYQVKEATGAEYKSILIIGKGDGIVPAILDGIFRGGRRNEDERPQIDTFDFDASLRPTYVGDVRNLNNIVKKKYDCIICCQVLEHLEWQFFEDILKEMKKVALKSVIISLPMRKIAFSVILDFPKFHYKIMNIVIPRIWEKKLVWKGQHYWEVGIRGCGKKRVLNIIQKYFKVKRHYLVPENTFHWFVIADVR